MNAVLEPEELLIEEEPVETPLPQPAGPARRRRRMRPFEILADLLAQTLANVRRNKLRSFLTLFGIAWGIASLVLMSALSDGFRVGQRQNMSQIGDNIVFVFPGRTQMQAGGERAGRWIHLTLSDVKVIRDQCPAVELVAGEQKTRGVAVRSSFNSGQFLILGVTGEYLRLRNLPVETGRPISTQDVDAVRRVAVLGSSVRKQLFENQASPIGQTIRINDYPYLVAGVMSEKSQNSSYDGWDNDKVLIPATALRRDCPPSREVYARGWVNGILYRPVSVDQWETAQQQVKTVLGRIYGFDPRDESAVHIWDTIEGAKLFDKVFDSGEIFLAAIALVTLALGGVGVMNTMMMAVAERTNEIGLKKALGATRRRILLDFFLEGLLLAVLSGAAGLALILLLAAGVNSLPLPAMFAGLPIKWTSLVFSTLALGTVAVLAALPPAWQAAQLTPVDALRHEK